MYKVTLKDKKYGNNSKIQAVLYILIVLFPLLPMLKYSNFYLDWFNHVWVIEYFGEYFKSNLTFPHVINTDNSFIGISAPLYYGTWFYRILGVISIVLGGKNAILFCAFICLGCQFITWKVLFDLILKKKSFLSFVAILPVWGIYALTNLYNRSAITEFFAVSILFTIVGLWLQLFFVEEKYKSFVLICFTIGLVLMVGTHPITVIYGGAFVAIIVLSTFPLLIKQKQFVLIRNAFICAVLFIFTILPWIYTNIKVMPGISNTASDFAFVGVDSLINRISFVPVDFRYLSNAFDKIGGGG